MVSFDFMQNLLTPNLTHNDVLKYKRQLWTNVFGIHDMVVDPGSVFIHHPKEVCMRDTYCAKVKIWKERVGDVSPEQLYHEPIVPTPKRSQYLFFIQSLLFSTVACNKTLARPRER
ncbi:unnamed protein product [Porites lobata]|uniref:Uncharacterized protein n=1 Tax=Porites lobata TaxID=104759 RepID=A0ABN8Q0I2_9CNID|nr:unnamed protein product [Porites lobata]